MRFRAHVSFIRGALAESDLVVVPSDRDESFGRVVIEAMAAGVPVVATRDGGIPEVLADRFDAHLVLTWRRDRTGRKIGRVSALARYRTRPW